MLLFHFAPFADAVAAMKRKKSLMQFFLTWFRHATNRPLDGNTGLRVQRFVKGKLEEKFLDNNVSTIYSVFTIVTHMK